MSTALPGVRAKQVRNLKTLNDGSMDILVMQIIDVTNESAARTLVKSLAKGRGWKVIKCRDFGACRVHWAAPNPIDAPEVWLFLHAAARDTLGMSPHDTL